MKYLTPIVFTVLIISSCKLFDTTPPTVSISSHYSGQIVGEIVKIMVFTDDNEGIRKVAFYINDEHILSDYDYPYQLVWNTTEVGDGEYIIKVRSVDNSGNSAESQPIMLKVDNKSFSPSEVNISSIVLENGGFTITWNKSTDTDFESYQLEKSTGSQMYDYNIIHFTTDINNTSYIDLEGDPLNYQYYRITVTDTFGLENKGRISSSSLDPIPNPVNVFSVSYTFTDMTVEWNQSSESDFKQYLLYNSKTKYGNKTLVDTFPDINTTAYSTATFDPAHDNWYWIAVEDTLGQIGHYGIGKTNAIDEKPSSSEIHPVKYRNNSFEINWSQNTDNDFHSYELFESESPDMLNQSLIYSTIDQNDTTYTYYGISNDMRKYLLLVVTDKFMQPTVSDTVSASSYEKIVFYNHSVLYKIDSDGNDKNYIANFGYPIFDISPDGNLIVFADGDELYIVDIDGKNRQPLTQEDYGAHPPRVEFTADGNYIVYSVRSQYLGQRHVYIVDIDGNNLMRLTDTGSNREARVTPDGDSIIYIHYNHETGILGINKMGIDGSNKTQLINSAVGGGHYSNPYISPDGLNILYTNNTQLYLLDIDGTNQVQLTSTPGNYTHYKFSNDGTKIVYVSDVSGFNEIYTMDIDGSNKMQLTSNGPNKTPVISNYDSKIYFSNTFSTIVGGIYSINLDGSNLFRITTNISDENPVIVP